MSRKFLFCLMVFSLLLTQSSVEVFARCLYDNEQNMCQTVFQDQSDCSEEAIYWPEFESCLIEPECIDGGDFSLSFAGCIYPTPYLCNDQYGMNEEIFSCQKDPSCSAGAEFSIETDKCSLDSIIECPSGYSFDSASQVCTQDPLCPSGSIYDPEINECIKPSQPLCPEGYIVNSSSLRCEKSPVCTAGSYDPAGNECKSAVTKLCPQGYSLNSTLNTCELTPTCPSGSSYDNSLNKCVAAVVKTCDTGFVYNAATDNCRISPSCATGGSYNASTNFCQAAFVAPYTCSTGGSFNTLSMCQAACAGSGACTSTQIFNTCTDSRWKRLIYTCSTTSQTWDTGCYALRKGGVSPEPGIAYSACTASCPAQAGTCSGGCPSGYTPSGTVCVRAATCPSGSTLNTATDKCEKSVIAQCPAGLSYNSGANACVQDVVCPDGGSLNAATDTCQANITNLCPDGLAYEAGKDACTAAAACDQSGLLNPVVDLCQLDLNFYCDTGFTLNANTSVCSKAASCLTPGELNIVDDRCIAGVDYQCEYGFTLENETKKCLADPLCSDTGAYSSETKQCEHAPIPVCNPGFDYIAENQICFQNLKCSETQTYDYFAGMCVENKEGTCTSGEVEAAKSIEITIDPPSPQLYQAQVSVHIEAVADGGVQPYQYRFLKQKAGQTDWQVIQEFSLLNVFNWSIGGEESGEYNLRVDAKNTCSSQEFEITKTASYEIKKYLSAESVTLAPNYESPQESGRIITFTATAAPENGLFLYRFWVKPSSQENWNLAYDYSTKNEWIWDTKGYEARNYIIKVDVKKIDSTDNFEATAQVDYELSAGPEAPDSTASLVNCPTDSSCDIKVYRADTPNIFAKHTIAVDVHEEQIPEDNRISFKYDGDLNTIICNDYWQNLSSSAGQQNLQNQIKCVISEDRHSAIIDLMLFDQGTFTNPYSEEPAEIGFANLTDTDEDRPFCTYEKSPYTATACVWEDDELTEKWLVYGQTTVTELVLFYKTPEVLPIEASTTFCGKDFNNDGIFQQGEIGGCYDSQEGPLCLVDMVRCLDATNQAICPTGGTLDPNIDKCVQINFKRCAPGYAFDANLGKCVQWVMCHPCPAGYTYDYDQNKCLMAPCIAPAQLNPQTGRCEVTTGYECPLTNQYFTNQNSCEQSCSKMGECSSGYTGLCMTYEFWTYQGKVHQPDPHHDSDLFMAHVNTLDTKCGENWKIEDGPRWFWAQDYWRHDWPTENEHFCAYLCNQNSTEIWKQLEAQDPITNGSPFILNPKTSTEGYLPPCAGVQRNSRGEFDDGAYIGPSKELACGALVPNGFNAAYVFSSIRAEETSIVCNLNNSSYTTMSDCRQSCAEIPGCLAKCPAGYNLVGNLCIVAPNCPFGGAYSQDSGFCELAPSLDTQGCTHEPYVNCASGYGFNPETGDCESLPICEAGAYRPETNDCISGYLCPYGEQYGCKTYNGNQYCSPFECSEVDGDIAEIGDPEGSNDIDDDGAVDENGECLGTVYIFNGKDMRCRSKGLAIAFGTCCKDDEFFFGLQKCNDNEKQLASLRNAKQCHYIGEYCSKEESLTGFCLEYKKSYCCFNSMLGKIIQEQGRPMLKTFNGWGDPKSPECRGFTQDEFQMIDFAKIDFSEWLPEIQTTNQNETQNNMQNAITNYYNNNEQ